MGTNAKMQWRINTPTLQGSFLRDIDFSIGSTVRCRPVDNGEATLSDLAHQTPPRWKYTTEVGKPSKQKVN